MSANITLPVLPLDKEYVLEFTIADPCEIIVRLLTDKDPTLVDTNYIPISSEVFIRDGEVNEKSGDVKWLESREEFINRTFEEATKWYTAEIDRHKEMKTIAGILGERLRKTKKHVSRNN